MSISKQNGPFDPAELRAVVYSDGGSTPNPGVSASAISVFTRVENGDVVHREHAKYHQQSTSQIAEYAAVVGALRYIKRMHDDDDKKLVIVDCLGVYNAILDNSKVKDTRLVPYADAARRLFLDVCGSTTLAFMYRDKNNMADEVVNRCKREARHIGDHALFPDMATVMPKAMRAVPAPVPPAPEVTPTPLVVNSVEDFMAHRKFKSRTHVPPEGACAWGSLTAKHLACVINAPTKEAREAEIIQLFLLPTRYLPVNASSTRVKRHLKSATPFMVDAARPPREERERDPNAMQHRLAEAVGRNARERRMRTANKLVHNTAAGDMPHDEKLEKLRAKLVSRDADGDDAASADADSFPLEDVPAFSEEEMWKALRGINRQSATSIDGWSRDLMVTAIKSHPSNAQNFCWLLHYLASQQHSQLLLDVLRAARLVGIPKPNNSGVRPICIANIWLKVIGSIAMNRDDMQTSKRQYAVGKRDGALKIVHEVRHKLNMLRSRDPEAEYVVMKFDVSNAFNTLQRRNVKKLLEKHPVTTRQYFRLAYGGRSPLAVYGPEGLTVLDMEEGIRQGDSTSTYLFCRGVDSPLEFVAEIFPFAWMYCDDLTLIVRRADVEAAQQRVLEAFARVGLAVNPDKTQIFDPAVRHPEPFVLLGCDLANTDAFVREKIEKQRAYFECLRLLPLHPQLKTTLLRLCGSPRILYFVRGMPTESIQPLIDFFQREAHSLLAATIGVSVDDIPSDMLHHRLGAGFPDYRKHARAAYQATHEDVINGIKAHVELVTCSAAPESCHTARHNLSADWLWYNNDMTPSEFVTAYCIRLGIVPHHLRIHPVKCACGTFVNNDHQQIEHAFRCDKFTTVTHTTRHNMVRDAMVRVAREWGISAEPEPTMYDYPDGKRRPDIMFCTTRPVATDITIVSPSPTADPGDTAAHADDAKQKIHKEAVARRNHLFISGAIESYGALGEQITRLISYLTQDLPQNLQYGFKTQFVHTLTTTLARARASALFGTKWKNDKNNIAPHV
jgi:ribonuclease HI